MKNRNSKSSTGRLSWVLSGVLKSKRAEGYVDTAVKVLIAVVIGALLLFGLYGLVGNVVIPTTTSKVSSLFNTTGVDGAGAGGGAGGGDTPVTPEPEIKREPGSIIPDGAKYTKADGTVLEGNGTNIVPSTPIKGDTYEEGDYRYTYCMYKGDDGEWDLDCNGWNVVAIDKSKQEYGKIINTISNKNITALYGTFDHSNIVCSPTIPNTVTNLSATYSYSTLYVMPDIPNGVVNMDSTFYGCTIVTLPVIPDSVTSMMGTFAQCTFYGLHGTETLQSLIPNYVTIMRGTFENCGFLDTVISIPSTVTDLSGTSGSWLNGPSWTKQ